jgi:hypothetical protein
MLNTETYRHSIVERKTVRKWAVFKNLTVPVSILVPQQWHILYMVTVKRLSKTTKTSFTVIDLAVEFGTGHLPIGVKVMPCGSFHHVI